MVALAQRRVGQRRLPRDPVARIVVAHDVLEGQDRGSRPDVAGVDVPQHGDRLQDPRQLALQAVQLLIGKVQASQLGDVLDVGSADHAPMLTGHNAPMTEAPRVEVLPLPGGRIERLQLPGGPGAPLLVVGGVETGLRLMAGTEQLLLRRWQNRAQARPVTVVGRPIPDDPSDAEAMLHPRASAAGVATAVEGLPGPFAIEAESGGGRISMWLSVERPELIRRLVLAASASETPPDSPMAVGMSPWIALAEQGAWSELFALQAAQLKPGGPESEAPPAAAFAAVASLQPRPSTPERFIAELRSTMDPSSFVTHRLSEIRVPTLVLAGGRDRVVPLAASQLVAERIPGARLEVDPDCGHTVRVSFRGYDALVEAFLAEEDPQS